MSKPFIDQRTAEFLTVDPKTEEALTQPLYHFKSYATAGATQFAFFNQAASEATNGYADTNMDTPSQLNVGKRAAIYGIQVVFLPGQNPITGQTTTANFVVNNQWNDLNSVLNGVGYTAITILEKNYGYFAPLAFLPAGFGPYYMGGGVSNTPTTAANSVMAAAGGTNGVPMPTAAYRLRVPLVIPPQVNFSVTLNFPTAVAISTAARIGIVLECVQIRARQ